MRWTRGIAVALVGLLGSACGADAPEPAAGAAPTLATSRSRDARPQTLQLLREDLATPRHASDGAGRAWLESPAGHAPGLPPRLRAGSRQHFRIRYEAGPLGVAVGGAIFLQPSPFWGWDSPQSQWPTAPGYTEVTTNAAGVRLLPEASRDPLLAIRVAGRGLRPGEQVEIRYGAGPAGTRIDRHAERSEHIWIAVDGDGDGVRALLQDSPRVDVVADGPAQLRLTLPSVSRPGEPFALTAAVLDGLGNAGPRFEGELVFDDRPQGLELPERVALGGAHDGHRVVEGIATREGIFRLHARVVLRAADSETQVLHAESNPMLVSRSAPRLLWADLHGHSQISDGTGTPDDYFAYARDIAGLDAAALTDHDHWGMRFLDRRPDLWAEIRSAVRKNHEPGRFVSLLGYEWTSWLHGHRHVLYFDDEGDVRSSVDAASETPAQLWATLAGRPALSFAHHSAGGPISTNWSYRPDPQVEPVTEIASVHGSSEAMDSPGRIYNPVEGNFVRDVLDRGLRFGFIGSGDSHDGHPGLTQLASGRGGLAAIFSEARTRQGILEALRARRCYATSGPRIWLRTALDGQPMGSEFPARTDAKRQQFDVAVVSPGPIERVDLVRSGAAVQSIAVDGRREWSQQIPIPSLAAGEYLYLRVVLRDGNAAWSSPFYAR